MKDKNYIQNLTKWINTQPIFTDDYDHRQFPGGGFATWDRREVTAISPPNLNPVEAIAFYRAVEILLP